MYKLTIDNMPLEVRKDSTILEAAREAGIHIPTLCFLAHTSAVAMCKLCVVSVEGEARPVCACNTPVRDGMHITTTTDELLAHRKQALKLLLNTCEKCAAHACKTCDFEGICELQALCEEYGLFIGENCAVGGQEASCAYAQPLAQTPAQPQHQPQSRAARTQPLTSHPFLTYDPARCLRCMRCVGACHVRAGNKTLRPFKRGALMLIEAPFDKNWKETSCESCGNCAQACPTGALAHKNRRAYKESEVEKVRTTCPHCGTGCQIDLVVKEGKIVDAKGGRGPANKGLLCVKGRFASFDFVSAPDRLTTPLIRNLETGELEPASWDDALSLVVERLGDIKREYGGKSIAAFACSRSTNEDIYLFQKMARIAFQTNNVDNCARVCHSPTVAGLAAMFGSGAMTNSIEDVTSYAQAILLVGSNPEVAHPVIGMQIRAARARGCKLIVVDPRDIGLASQADVHLKLRPGTNVAFANGMAHVIISEGLADESFISARTEGFAEFREALREYSPERVAEICGIDERVLVEAARIYASARPAAIIYCLGVTEHTTGTDGVMSLGNLALLTGNIGKPGAGVNPLRGQNNVQGGCDMGALPDNFPGYQRLTDSAAHSKFEQAWNVSLPTWIGAKATECFPEMIKGNIRALYLFGEDPVRTDPDTTHVIKALKSLDFLVVSDLFLTETARYAHVVLPGRSYAEKEGTFTNTERRVQRVRKACVSNPGTRLDTDVFAEIMQRMGYDQPQLTSAEIMDEIASLVPSFAGISHARLDSEEVAASGLCWPCVSAKSKGTPILHTETFTCGRAHFKPLHYCASAELPDESFPLLLSTGRVLYHYNACAMTGRTEGLDYMEGSSFIEINTEDARALGVADGARVRVSSRRASIESTARVSGKTNPGQVWMPFHFQDGNSNWLTIAALDKVAKAPEYKVCAVRVEAL